jgi:peptide/nickel transport system substrate-binding protein
MKERFQFKRLLWTVLAVMVFAGMVGCGTAQPVTTPPTALAPVEAPTAVPTAAGPSSITVVIPEDPPGFNALISDTGYDALVMKMVLLGMTAVGPDGTVYPVLAAELPTEANGGVVVNPDGAMDVTWKMRNDVMWSDGTPVTADDVLFTYKAMTDKSTGTWFPGSDLVTGVDKIDDHSFVVHFSSVYPSYLTLFGGRQIVIWPAHFCKADQGYQNWDCGSQPLSDGPYTLREWVTGDHLTFVKNPKYYQSGKPAIDQIIVKVVPDTTVRETMMHQGDADVLMWATEQVADNLKNAENVKVSISPTARFVMRLFINLAARGSTDPVKHPSPLFADVRVRQAIRSAIDVDAITSSVWHGFAKPVWSEFFRQPYVCDIPRPKFDVEAAKTLLEQAGWIDQNGDGIRECHGCKNAKQGTDFKFELATYSEYGEPLILTQQLIAENLKAVGIEADLLQMQGSVMWADTASGGTEQGGNFEVDLYDDGYAGVDPTDFIWQYYNSGSATPDQGWNVGRWINPQFDELLNSAYTLNEADRNTAFCEMAKILDQELPEILLFSTINADAYSTRLNGVQANVNSVVSWNVADWTLGH